MGFTTACIAQRRSTLVFCVNLAHVRDLTATFREAGVDARYVHAGTPAAERKALIADFRAGAFPVLLNCGELIVGSNDIQSSMMCSNIDRRHGHTQHRLYHCRQTDPFSKCLCSDGGCKVAPYPKMSLQMKY